MSLLTSSFNSDQNPASPEMAARVNSARERAMHELLPNAMLFSLICTLGTALVLQSRVQHPGLETWMVARMLMSCARFGYSAWFLMRAPRRTGSSLLVYRGLTAADGLTWSALVWGLTPLDHLEIAVVTISVVIGVATLGTFILHVDLPSVTGFVTTIMLPNIGFVLARGDDLGTYCAAAFVGTWVILLNEGRRSNLRIKELLTLRFQSEQVAQIRDEALQQAKSLSEAKSRFVATMSHEMRTPLHGILGLTRQLRAKAQDTQSLRQLDLIKGSGEHLVNVINDILDFSSIEAGKLPIHAQPFNLRTLLQEMVETSKVSAHDKGLSLFTSIEMAHDVDAIGDPVRIRQVLHNLLGNAIKFTPRGHVRLSARHDVLTGVLTVQVSDTGVGIPAADVARVFEAFHQAEGTYQRRFGGTGLGLTISRDLCRAMGGELLCVSELGKGSVFSFTLPLPVHHAAPAAQVAPSVRVHGEHAAPHALGLEGPPHVLLVEDNPVNAMIAEAELRALGVKVSLLDNGQDAVDWLAHNRVDLVLMDCEMPVMDGFEATRRIREHERQCNQGPVGIIALTANGKEVVADRYRSAGMDDHLAKPYTPSDLARLLRRHLQGAPSGWQEELGV
ncbi:MAG: response regulator [Aquabacterium sp.]|uniref:ATP-binding protein n=1 Tax=Aquabacterium sp. TaxID=1872578 RepID=UPI0025BF3CBD|nr:ATP-binding protein [Aquabacterium sp.]MBI3382187.1 response regulator [Aquabacterium sp.]